ncbi:arylalkylamine N-acetyltransferase 1-like [Mytilus edulis]|uniref:arylalkylamine N-acetyltransferase 1-like n=1 Tax=Mytilus edulis TaxID=6550 RepID=UPI0039F05498
MADNNDNLRPRRELEEVLRRIDKSLNFEDAHLELSSDELTDSLILFLKENFWPDEPLWKSLGLQIDEEVTRRFASHVKDNLSILLVSNTSGEIIGCRTMFLDTLNEANDKADDTGIQQIKNEKLKKVRTFLGHKWRERDVFQHFGVTRAMHFLALAIHKKYRGRGIASKLMQASLAFCKELGFTPVCIVGECTSEISQKIFEKFDFENVYTVRYDEYKVNDEIVFTNTGDNKTAKFFVKQL